MRTMALDAASCHTNKDTLLPDCCCLQPHNRGRRRVTAINEIASEAGYNSCERPIDRGPQLLITASMEFFNPVDRVWKYRELERRCRTADIARTSSFVRETS